MGQELVVHNLGTPVRSARISVRALVAVCGFSAEPQPGDVVPSEACETFECSDYFGELKHYLSTDPQIEVARALYGGSDGPNYEILRQLVPELASKYTKTGGRLIMGPVVAVVTVEYSDPDGSQQSERYVVVRDGAAFLPEISDSFNIVPNEGPYANVEFRYSIGSALAVVRMDQLGTDFLHGWWEQNHATSA